MVKCFIPRSGNKDWCLIILWQPDKAQYVVTADTIAASKYLIWEKHPNNGYTQCSDVKWVSVHTNCICQMSYQEEKWSHWSFTYASCWWSTMTRRIRSKACKNKVHLFPGITKEFWFMTNFPPRIQVLTFGCWQSHIAMGNTNHNQKS